MILLKKVEKNIAVELLNQGKAIIFPTETSYGLGCDATNQEAVDKIFKIKGRGRDKPLLVVVPTIKMAKDYLEWNETLGELAKKDWPGALTIVVRVKPSNLAKGVVSKDGTVAIRVTAAETPKYLSEQIGKPIVATSANLADVGDVYNSDELIEMYTDKEFFPDAIIDVGVLEKNPPTTIISVVGGNIKVLRQGEIKI